MISALYILAIIALQVIGAVLFAPDYLVVSILSSIFLILMWLVSPGRDPGRAFVGPLGKMSLIFAGGAVVFFTVYLPKDVSMYGRLSLGFCAGSWFLLFYAVAFRIVRRISRWLGVDDAATGSGMNRSLGSFMAAALSQGPLRGGVEEDGRAEELGLRVGRRVARLRRQVRRLFG